MDLNLQGNAIPAAAPSREQSRITARIGTLVLRGFPAMRSERVEEAFVGELSRLLKTASSHNPAWTERRADEVRPLRLRLNTQPTAGTIGRDLARAIFREIAGREESPR
jgi:hypothetical protein